jgi:bacillithiol biosynthesis cysteine-adding enzyme BshC
MDSIVIDRRKTFFHNDFLEDYYNTNKLDHLRTYAPTMAEISRAIENKRTFSQFQRNTLATVLEEQYQDARITVEGKLKKNIDSLRQSNTYTVTTGQQIHLGLGPLYVIYKALDIIAIAKELSEEHKDFNFVPVFWMATEDHDLEEIAEISVFGNKVKWETTQKGAVGRMKPDGVAALFDSIKKDYNFSEEQSDFLSKCSHIYSTSENLSIAFRALLHEYIGETGVVILDADNKLLKESFSRVLSDELQFKNYAALTKSSAALEKTGYKKQLQIRECNLFDLRNGDRVKVLDKQESDTAEAHVQQDGYNLSPNAALRPFYQEWILPNLVYVGGPSELKYWLQLKGIFDNYRFPMPLLHLRKSNVLLPLKLKQTYGQEDFEMLFNHTNELLAHYSMELYQLEESFDQLYNSIIQKIERYADQASVSFPGFNLEGKVSKLKLKLDELPSLIKGQLIMKSEQKIELKRLLKIKERYFYPASIQEREEHLLVHVSLLKLNKSDLCSQFGFTHSQKVGLILT